ncbi:MAG: alpha-N-arabinofuranosidase [Lachnospiraceae bacterium]|nr:alpha-N-arabinofuranosidase [Lachnospiraceae bacterium]
MNKKNAYLTFDKDCKKSTINKDIYGHFAEHLGRCVYEGIFVGKDSQIPNINGIRKDVAEALKELNIPVLRWPGGCFADTYKWEDGVGERRKILNKTWGDVVEDNSFGTHEFFELCELIGCDAYISGNVGSGTPRELSEWLEYITYDGESYYSDMRRENGRDEPWRLKYLGIGNENWGGGGNMTPEFYASLYRQFQTYARSFNKEKTFKIACGPDSFNYAWTGELMKHLNEYNADAIALHYYTLPTGEWEKKGAALNFPDDEYYATMYRTNRIEELIRNHSFVMEQTDPEHKIKLVVDEWGAWYDVEDGTNAAFLYQQNTMRDAILAAINLNIFNNHSDIVMMANIAQTVNVLQSVIICREDDTRLIKTPTYHVFDMYKKHQNATLLASSLSTPELMYEGNYFPMISESVSIKDDKIFITLSNASLDTDCELLIDGGSKFKIIESKVLDSDVREYNDYDSLENVAIHEFKDITFRDNKMIVLLPAHSVVSVLLEEEI